MPVSGAKVLVLELTFKKNYPDIRNAREFDAAAIVAVAHHQLKDLGVAGVRDTLQPNGLVYDLKYIFDRESVDIRL